MTLEIRYDPRTGRVELQGPLDNGLLCYGLLEKAKEILMRRQLDLAPPAARGPDGKPLIVPAIALPKVVRDD